MSKLRVGGTVVTLVLFAAVAVFPVVQALTSKKASRNRAGREFKSTGVLIADGGDPWPPPPSPIPWPNQSA